MPRAQWVFPSQKMPSATKEDSLHQMKTAWRMDNLPNSNNKQKY